MASTLQTMREGGTQHPEEIMAFLLARQVSIGGVFDKSADHLKIEEEATPAMSVKINEGYAVLPKSDGSMAYPIRLYDGAASATITSNASGNTRIDAVVLYIDLGASANAAVTNVAKFVVVAGTPAGSPVAPTDAEIQTSIGASNPFMRLADVTVASGSTSIVDADILDKRDEKVYNDIMTREQVPNGHLLNGKIVPSVTSNNLTVSVKTLAGTDPSATDPVFIRIGDTVRSITSTLSVTANTGTNWLNSGGAGLATKEVDYFAYIGYNATDGVVIGFARIPFADVYSDFSATTTDEKYCAISTITNASATDDYIVIGRFAATLSAGAGYTWSVPTFTGSNLVQSPIKETRWLQWAATMSGTGSMGVAINAGELAIYQIVGRAIFVKHNSIITISGTPSYAVHYDNLPMSVNEIVGAGNGAYGSNSGILEHSNGHLGSVSVRHDITNRAFCRQHSGTNSGNFYGGSYWYRWAIDYNL